ncbi:stAR-related lipid transfer protein 9 [Astyanax mexicanus]|uniref:StAR-related lipid transfer protein 9 n=1 Tax=Astyanax mexicanus TaxID=7994 RepID=A0A8T2LA21_ASTMX|nr:stAR-related lipid transfer protein 9 [Astyanax mexicanus]
MANVKVAIRVRPLNSRESVDGGRIAVQVEDKVVKVKNVKLEGRLDGRAEAPGDSRERLLEFGFDYCYWSVNTEAPNYASQEDVFQDLGVSVLAGAAEGYNICLFAYGQTGSGKTYTMMGTPNSMGLTPRICQGLFRSDMDSPDGQNCRVEISFLEIYNERVRDLLRGMEQKKPAPLRVREHPEKGPYVQGLSQHVVSDYKQAVNLLEEGIANRITAATHVHDASSRSHAIFSIQYTQAILENNLPSEIVSKINLVDLAGSERADPHYCRDRITEGANINKSLVTLGIVISALAQNSQMCSSSQSINSMLSEGEGSTVGSHFSSLSSSVRRQCFIPYRDSVLTWLLKDSLGGNSKTIMIATISPSYSSYNETLSTLRYAAHARNIVNKPRVNEDANVRLIRELREEVDRLKSMLLNFSMQRNPSPSLSDERESSFSDIVLQNELKVEQLTKDWSESWRHKRSLLEEYSVDINQDKAGVQIHSLLPHLIAMEPDVLSTGVMIYHLREGVTRIGPHEQNGEEPHIVLPEGSMCEIENRNGVVTLRPLPYSVCVVNDRVVTENCRLAQGAVITLGGLHKFRFNHPAEAAVLRERRRTSEAGLLCGPSELNSFKPYSRTVGTGCQELSDGSAPRQRLEEQQHYVECLQEEIQVEQRRAEKELEIEQAHLRQQCSEIEQWIWQEKQRLAAIREKGTLESAVQTDFFPMPVLTDANKKPSDRGDEETVRVRKKVVQEELLKHHALRRAESRVRRKRLHYQLERIARKRHLLEAKRELQRLENAFPLGVQGSSSPELGSPSKCRGRPIVSRRHSFSAELLSRLYPQHIPIFSQFLRRNRSSDSTSSLSGFTYPRKWLSDEFLPDQNTRTRSNTMPSRYSHETSSRVGSTENLIPLQRKNLPSGGMTKLESSIDNHTGNHRISSESPLDSNNKDKRKVLPIIKQSSTQKGSSKGGKCGGSKGLESIRKVLSKSVGSGIKTALSRVFRKPPLGLRGSRSAKSASRVKAQFVSGRDEDKDKFVGDKDKTNQKKQPIKATVSCYGLESLTLKKDKQQRRWHSAEALTNKTKKWVRRQQGLTGCEENDVEEETDGSSDCDRHFSMDSLSSAYATALAEQLQQEEFEPSEAESEDSQMSKDSLVMESSGKHITARPAFDNKPNPEFPTHSFQSSFSSQSIITKLKMEKSKEMPAEAYWSLHSSPKPGRLNKSRVAKESSSNSELTFESRPSSNSSVREPENLLALTDAWSSTDAADSPRSLRMSEGLLKQALHKPLENRSSQSPTSLDLSGTLSINESEGQKVSRSDSTESQGDKTLEEQSHRSSELETTLDHCWSDLDSTPCSTHERTLLYDSTGLYAKGEPCNTETMEVSLFSSASTDDHENDMLNTNIKVPLENNSVNVVVVHAYSKDFNDSLRCYPDKSIDKDMQITIENQTVSHEDHISSTGESSFNKGYATQEHFKQSKQEGKTQCAEHFGTSQLATGISECDRCQTSSSSAFPSPTVLRNTKNQFFISSSEDLHHSNLETEISSGSQSSLENLAGHVEKAVTDRKNSIKQYQEMSELSLSEKTYTETNNTRNTEDGTLKTSLKSQIPFEVTGNRSRDCPDVSLEDLKNPQQCSKETLAQNHSAVIRNNEPVKLHSANDIRDPTRKVELIEKEISSGYMRKKVVEDSKESPMVKDSIKSNSQNSNNSSFNCKSDDRPVITGPDQNHQTSSSLHVQENDTVIVKEITDSQKLDSREFQKIGLAIHEKISEVVKEHLNMTFNMDEVEDVNREQEACRKTISLAIPSTDDLDMFEGPLKHSPCVEAQCVTKQELHIDKSTKVNGESYSQGESFVKCSSTEKDNFLHHQQSEFISNGSFQSVDACTVDCSVQCAEPTDNQLDSLNAGYQNDTVVTPPQSTVMSAPEDTQCPKATSYTNITKAGKIDPYVMGESDPDARCQNSTTFTNTVRAQGCGIRLESVTPRLETHPKESKEGNFSDISNSLKESKVLKIIHHVQDCIASEMPKEVDNKKCLKVSKGDITVEFQKYMKVSTESKISIEKKNKCSVRMLNSDLCQATDKDRIGKHHILNLKDQPYAEQNTNMSSNTPKSSPEDPTPQTTISEASKQALPHTSCVSLTQSNDQINNIQKVIINGTVHNNPQPEDQSVFKGHHKYNPGKLEGQSKNIQGEEILKPASHLQFQESESINIDSTIHTALLAKGEKQTGMKEANKPDPKSSVTSKKSSPLNTHPKDHKHINKIEPTEKTTGVEDHTKPVGARLTSCSNNDERQRAKPKKYRRAHFTAPPSSSTDSTPDSSFDEIAKTRAHQCSPAARAKLATAFTRTNVFAQNRAGTLSLNEQNISLASAISASLEESKSKMENCSQGDGIVAEAAKDGSSDKAKMGSSLQKRQSSLTAEKIPTQDGLLKDKEEALSVTRRSFTCFSPETKPEVPQLLQNGSVQNREPTLHFASSDINPFIYARKCDDILKVVPKNLIFGSAINISSKLSQLESADKRITRCCSVDNGLNNQNSPFNSHLSTYAVQKGLSSTLSSVEDSKEHIAAAPNSQLKEVCRTSFVSSDKTLADSSCESFNNTSDLGLSSGQVDEIVLVYSSEQETPESENQNARKCDHGTQTALCNEEIKENRHRRSNTQDPGTQKKQAHGTSTTWASLQNMSEHLSELILNTSDLLGNIQGMRTEDQSPRKYEHPQKNCSKVLKVYLDKPCKRDGKKDGSTQTTVDVGIQTEAPLLVKPSKVLPKSPLTEKSKAHEVNVIVKVIGSDFCSDSAKQNGMKCFQDQCENRQSFETIRSMPDLRPEGLPTSEQLGRKLDITALKRLSLEAVSLNQDYSDPCALTDTVDQIPSKLPSSCFGVCSAHSKCSSDLLARKNQGHRTKPKPKICPDKRVLLMDRASSPILTVDVSNCSQKGQTMLTQCSSNHRTTKMQTNSDKLRVSRTLKNPIESKQLLSREENKELHQINERKGFCVHHNEKFHEDRSVSSCVSCENFSDLYCKNGGESDVYSTEATSLSGRCAQDEIKKKFFHRVPTREASAIYVHGPPSPGHSSSVKHRQQREDCSRNLVQSSTPINRRYESSPLQHNLRLSQDSLKCWSDMNKSNLQYQDEDVESLALSECNTDLLVSINPLTETHTFKSKEDQWIPDALPMHNKFTNWSGINQLSKGFNNEYSPTMNKPPECHKPAVECRAKPELVEKADRRTREIERLRKEREQVLASVSLDMNPQQLSVELTEAKLHYGLGETDTLLKMLQSSPKEEPAVSTKQQLYDRHRRSIDNLKKERQVQLQNCRRARSLSPSKHPNSPSHETEKSQRCSDRPSRRLEYLQQLRQEVVEMSRVPDPVRRGSQCPSDIEFLLRDYSRAREEARTEIARARERLRERTEQEKRRLQQQALAQTVKDDLRLRTRFSSSTLCTGSNLSLSSGPTSGYNSSNAALLKDGTSPSIQITGVTDVGLRVRSRPPLIPPQSLKAPRVWLSAQDVRLETSSSRYEPQSSSSPSSPPPRQRTFSFGSRSLSLSTSYQDIADCTLSSAISEVNLASGGDLRNLLAGKVAAGWRYQGMERGVQTFHRPCSRPTAHSFLGAVELDRPLASLWSLIRDHSKTHLYNESLKTAWTRPLDSSTQLVYLLTDPSKCQLKQPRDFCCLSTESKQDDMWVLAMQSVFEESLPRPSVDAVRGEMLPSAWILQPSQHQGREMVKVIYLLQVDLGSPSLPQRLLSTVARKQAAVIADLDSSFSFS